MPRAKGANVTRQAPENQSDDSDASLVVGQDLVGTRYDKIQRGAVVGDVATQPANTLESSN